MPDEMKISAAAKQVSIDAMVVALADDLKPGKKRIVIIQELVQQAINTEIVTAYVTFQKTLTDGHDKYAESIRRLADHVAEFDGALADAKKRADTFQAIVDEGIMVFRVVDTDEWYFGPANLPDDPEENGPFASFEEAADAARESLDAEANDA